MTNPKATQPTRNLMQLEIESSTSWNFIQMGKNYKS